MARKCCFKAKTTMSSSRCSRTRLRTRKSTTVSHRARTGRRASGGAVAEPNQFFCFPFSPCLSPATQTRTSKCRSAPLPTERERGFSRPRCKAATASASSAARRSTPQSMSARATRPFTLAAFGACVGKTLGGGGSRFGSAVGRSSPAVVAFQVLRVQQQAPVDGLCDQRRQILLQDAL